MKTRITELLAIEHPIVQAGMSWASSSAALPAAVSNAGGLGVIAAGPMRAQAFQDVLDDMHGRTRKPFAVNIPLYCPQADDILGIMHARRIPIVIASQGNPEPHLARFHACGAKWIHVVASLEHARKAQAAGVDALVVVGCEAGGHPPADGVTTLITVRLVLGEVSIPVIAGGGAADGWGIAALLALGADAVQLGTRFLMTHEATVHPAYKEAVLYATAADAVLVGRKRPVRTLKNGFTDAMLNAAACELPQDAYEALFQQATLKQAALQGDVTHGKVEAGQSAGLVTTLEPAGALMQRLIRELNAACTRMATMATAPSPSHRPSHESARWSRSASANGVGRH